LTYQFAAALITSRSSGKTPAKTCKASVAHRSTVSGDSNTKRRVDDA
jgi:hypothetical protein